MSDISYPTAVFAGALSFLSPCVLPLVPPYLCYMAGVSADDLRTGPAVATTGYARLLATAVAFVLGFSTVFVALGAGASSVGQVLRQNLDWLGIVAGIAIIVMGLNFLGLFRIGLLSREARLQAPDRPKSLIGAYLMGLAFAFGWTPCIGPVLGAILGLAGAKGTVGEGAVMLGFYSAGLGIPFILAAAFSGAFLRWLSGFKRHLGAVEKVMGGLLVVTGVLFLSGGMQSISFWLLETFPGLQTIG
ncbi:cytochrome c biogenesis CcdA family protein [Aurantimonas sp. VKM B-3413]|uniref:cytochrome c biogenesis CcdA family protein n=1 Tax=Aurantimonas sp. VKM B-3413 TaxID=2779401 RepID=UPI001E46118E|nr:cytochrome c biogenesis CcdA family protein [Aurantimonas sp. VKM B-3413]MCB8839682.1 cytochrome c biogenesis CcdA family protein [Aurantimonas sp. VKM B-3413]